MFSLVVIAAATAGILTSIFKKREERIVEMYERQIRELTKQPNVIIKEVVKEKETIVPKKKTEEMSILDIMESIYMGDTLERFSLVSIANEKAKYQYLQNGYLFTVLAEEDRTQCFIQKDNNILLEFDYDVDYSDFDKKKFSRSLMMGKSREDALHIIDTFIEEMKDYDWYDIEEGLEIFDDMNNIEPYIANDEESKSEETVIQDSLNEVDSFTKMVKEEFSDNELKTNFLSIMENIQLLSINLDQFDMESKHLFENLLTKDVTSLFTAYIKLEDENKEAYREEVLESLTRIGNKLLLFKQRVEGSNLHELNKTIEVIKKRY